jgi:hypothetical protein
MDTNTTITTNNDGSNNPPREFPVSLAFWFTTHTRLAVPWVQINGVEYNTITGETYPEVIPPLPYKIHINFETLEQPPPN